MSRTTSKAEWNIERRRHVNQSEQLPLAFTAQLQVGQKHGHPLTVTRVVLMESPATLKRLEACQCHVGLQPISRGTTSFPYRKMKPQGQYYFRTLTASNDHANRVPHKLPLLHMHLSVTQRSQDPPHALCSHPHTCS